MSDSRLCIDLCCGLKGFSQAFVDAGWEVITVDINPSISGQYAEESKRLGNSELLKREKMIDIPFSELSPRAQKLYLEAVEKMNAPSS